MDIIVSKLNCGIKYAFKQIASPVAYCALSIKVGTRDECPSLNGIAHFTEHMLFKGTQKRRASSINSYLEKLGGELNAYTTKEEIVIHSTVLKEDLAKAVEMLSDLAFNSIFPEKELLKERGVILEEVSSYKDAPSELIFDDFDEFLFGDHPLSMPILGVPKTIKKIGVEDLKEFTKKNFILNNMSFSIVADISPNKGQDLVNRYFGSHILGDYPPKLGSESPLAASIKKADIREMVVNKKTFQSHCIIGSRSYSLYDENRLPMALMTNILGGPALNSRLNTALREKHALAYSVDASYTPYSDTGIFSVYFGTDKANINKCQNLIYTEFNKLINGEMTLAQLKASKKQLLGQLAIASDNAEAQCLNMGKALLVYGRVEPIELIREKIEAITTEQIHKVAKEIFEESNLYTIIYK